jgi:hypothetical protein
MMPTVLLPMPPMMPPMPLKPPLVPLPPLKPPLVLLKPLVKLPMPLITLPLVLGLLPHDKRICTHHTHDTKPPAVAVLNVKKCANTLADDDSILHIKQMKILYIVNA